jgi:hypothetical protein
MISFKAPLIKNGVIITFYEDKIIMKKGGFENRPRSFAFGSG